MPIAVVAGSGTPPAPSFASRLRDSRRTLWRALE
jgi:hypothetical protein